MEKNELKKKFSQDKLKKLMEESNTDKETDFNKEKRTGSDIALSVVTIAVCVIYYAILAFGKYFLPEDGIFYQSINVFSDAEEPNFLLRIMSFTILIFSLSRLFQILLSMMADSKTLTKKTGVAVIKLASNIVKFLAPILLILLILNTMGVQTAELLAGLGILSLILGLGVTSMVEDIVAGMFIIAEHTFDVGDIVTIDGFRGKVISIGMRSTQIEDEGGDVLILRNSTIGSLVNMTTMLSYAYCPICISPKESIERVEKILESSMDEIKENVPDIKEGPFYGGITKMDANGIQLEIVAGCDEDTKYDVEAAINRELKILLERNHIELGIETPVFG